MRAGQLKVKKYESVGHDERFGTPFAHTITLKVPKDALRPKLLALRPHIAGPMCKGRLKVKKYESVGHDECFGTPFVHVMTLKVPKDAHRAKFLALRAKYAGPKCKARLKVKKIWVCGSWRTFWYPICPCNDLKSAKRST